MMEWVSDASFAPTDATLLSPPRDWPRCFQTDQALRDFLGKGRLGAKRCRLVRAPPPQLAEQASRLALDERDSCANARIVRDELGWPVVGGVAVFEFAGGEHQFAATRRWWNCAPGDVWVDLTPHKPAAGEAIVLAETSPNLLAETSPQKSDARAQEIRAAALAQRAKAKAEAMEQPAREDARRNEARRKVMGEWKVHGVKKGRIRLGLSPSGRYALEAECWSPAFVDMETHDEFFEDLDPNDEHYADACQMRVKGTWELMQGFISFKVNSIETVGPASQYLPLKPEQVPNLTRGDLESDGWAMTVKFNGKLCRFEKG
ncbi:hypothetical protein AB1Y20_002703 [Prymnesium parvum]|uniref:Uncharacterized protein n=1 Tax=Prymnesium parvum TaxID=97485 RepID=A0AB34JBY4_PRYPA